MLTERIEKLVEDDWEEAVYQAALFYAKEGCYLIPIRPGGKEIPQKSTGYNYNSASRTTGTLKKWFGPGGKFRGWNIGIACGRKNGVFAIDLDVKNDKDGINQWEAQFKGVEMGPIQETPSGGRHILYRWTNESCRSTSGALAPDIDTRGGPENACSSHIVVYPSIIAGQTYEWLHWCEIPEAPSEVTSALGRTWKGNPVGRGNEGVGETDVEEKVPIEQIRRMLETINPNDFSYDDWVHIGMAIHSQHPDDEGRDTWKEWCKRGERYEPGEVETRWDGFAPDGRVRFGTLAYFAKEAGWVKQEDDVVPDRLSSIIDEMNMTYAVTVTGGKFRIIREQPGSFEGDDRFTLMGIDDFKNSVANQKINFQDNNGKVKTRSVGEVWLAHERRREYPNGIHMVPGRDVDGYYNTWKGWRHEPDESKACALFLSHIFEIVCNGEDELYQWVLDWMADAVQDPENPKGCCLVLRGEEGTGKGTFAEIFGKLFIPHYTHITDQEHLMGKFNARIAHSLLVFADEVTYGGNRRAANKLKGMVTERFQTVERKGIELTTEMSYARYIIASNEEWVIPAGPQSRRWCVLDVSGDRRGEFNYFKQIQDEMANGGMEALMHVLKNRKITSNLYTSFYTSALGQQRQLQWEENSTWMWWKERLDDEELMPDDSRREDGVVDAQNIWPERFPERELHSSYVSWCNTRRLPAEPRERWRTKLERVGLEFFRGEHEGESPVRKRMAKIPTLGRAKMMYNKQSGYTDEH